VGRHRRLNYADITGVPDFDPEESNDGPFAADQASPFPFAGIWNDRPVRRGRYNRSSAVGDGARWQGYAKPQKALGKGPAEAQGPARPGHPADQHLRQEVDSPKHKVQHDLGILPINTFVKKLIHHDGEGGKHGGFHGGGKGRDGGGNCVDCQ
jgi:hypothetical protein